MENGYLTDLLLLELQGYDKLRIYNNLININTKNGLKKADSIINKNSVLITRKNHKLRDDFMFLQKKLTHTKNIGDWIIYF